MKTFKKTADDCNLESKQDDRTEISTDWPLPEANRKRRPLELKSEEKSEPVLRTDKFPCSIFEECGKKYVR